MSTATVNITTPVGRIVMGSLYKPNTTDAEGKPLVVKNGPNAGQPRTNYFFALAIQKGQETHWANASYTNHKGELVEWGKTILNVGYTAFPQSYQSPAFAWKIEDGDSTIPNKKGRKPCDNEGWKGHWILKLSGGFAPKIYRAENGGHVQVLEENYVKPGYFVQVAMTVAGNDSQSQPGVYLNHQMVAFAAYGPEIVFGPDVNEAGFGAAQLPAGASTVPLGAVALPSPTGVPSVSLPTPIPVLPSPQFLQVPANPTVAVAGIPQIPGTATVIPAIVSPVSNVTPVLPMPSVMATSPFSMTVKANGATREQMLGVGWTDAQLIAQGYMNA